MYQTDEGDANYGNELQQASIRLLNLRRSRFDNVLGEDEAIWSGVSDEDE
jgi:hypothetical protein